MSILAFQLVPLKLTGHYWLQITVASLNIHGNHAYEFSSFAERWVDPDGSRMTELGRYVTAYVVDQSGRWRIVRIFGFTDSVSKEPRLQ